VRYWIVSFLLLIGAIGLGLYMAQDTGYVLLAYRHWTVETSLWTAVGCLVLSFLVCFIVLRSFLGLLHIPRSIRQFRKVRAYRKSLELNTAAFCAMIEGDATEAEALSLRAAELIQQPLMSYLIAAKAAQQQSAYHRRDQYLQEAYASVPKFSMAVAITQGTLEMESGQPEVALKTMQYWNEQYPRHRHLLTLLKTTAQQLQDWALLHQLLPALRRYKIESSEQLDALEKNIYSHWIITAAQQSQQMLIETWRTIPRRFRQEMTLLKLYTAYLIHYENYDQAIMLIEGALKRHWDSELARVYTDAQSTIPLASYHFSFQISAPKQHTLSGSALIEYSLLNNPLLFVKSLVVN